MTQAYILAQYLMKDVRNYLLTPKKGQGMVEYALIIALIAIVVAIALPALATAISNTFGEVQGSLPAGEE